MIFINISLSVAACSISYRLNKFFYYVIICIILLLSLFSTLCVIYLENLDQTNLTIYWYTHYDSCNQGSCINHHLGSVVFCM